jgi:pilus assembly protein CpaB
MRNSSIVVLVLGVVIAAGVALSLKSRMGGEAARTQVLIAAVDLPAGSFVRSAAHLAFTDWPEDKIAESMLVSGKVNPNEFDGSVVRTPIQKGTPILAKQLVRASEGGFMSAVLEPGKRAISIAVDATTGNAGFIFPGDKVDLILTVSINQGGQPTRASETFMQNIRVLAIDQMMGNPENKVVLAKTVTMEVTPKQAEEINVAKDLGKISLSLRSLAAEKSDVASTEASPQSFDDVLRTMGGAVPTQALDTGVTRDTDVSRMITPQGVAGSVRVIRGGDSQVIEFNGDAGRNDVR